MVSVRNAEFRMFEQVGNNIEGERVKMEDANAWRNRIAGTRRYDKTATAVVSDKRIRAQTVWFR